MVLRFSGWSYFDKANLCQHDIKHLALITPLSPPIVEKGFNATISMVQRLRNVNPCAQLKKIPNVIHILKDSQNLRDLWMIPTAPAHRKMCLSYKTLQYYFLSLKIFPLIARVIYFTARIFVSYIATEKIIWCKISNNNQQWYIVMEKSVSCFWISTTDI